MSHQRVNVRQGTNLSSALALDIQELSNLNKTMACGDLWIQWFTCCVTQQPPPRRRRPPIDRSMIGLPMNFQHTAHIGSSDIALGTSHLVALQNHMQSKGGYETAVPVEESVSRHAQPLTVT